MGIHSYFQAISRKKIIALRSQFFMRAHSEHIIYCKGIGAIKLENIKMNQ